MPINIARIFVRQLVTLEQMRPGPFWRYYAAHSVYSLPTFRDNQSVPSSRAKTHEKGHDPSRWDPLRNYHDTLSNILRRMQISSTSRQQSEITHDNGVISLQALRNDPRICLVSTGTASLKYRIYTKGSSSLTVTSVTATYTWRNLLASTGVPWTLFECGSSEAKLRN